MCLSKVKNVKKIVLGMVVSALLLGSLSPEIAVCAEEAETATEEERKITHGTATEWITEDMVNNTPSPDYVINQTTQGEAKNGAYSEYFLKEEIQTVHIEMEENNLNYLLQNAQDEPYVMTNTVTIGDVTLGYCGLRTKGSYTLEHAVTDNEGSDRFSFTINFGKYIKKKDYGAKQNFFGCDKISFNNFFFDKTMMKEFFALKLLDEMGLPTPEYGIAKLYINGNYYGVYAMVEAMDHSILERYYGVDKDELSSYLCKPEDTSFLYDEIQADPSLLWEQDEDILKDVEDMLPTVNEWVRCLNFLSNGMDFNGQTVDINSEEYLQLVDKLIDTDEVVKYFAVHSWLCQMDNMFDGYKNFGLYIDRNGRALLVPWDYDLSFGCFYPSTAETTANYPLDVMYRMNFWDDEEEATVSKKVYESFPLFHIIYQNDTLMEKYHGYMAECSKVAALGGTVASTGKTYEPGYFNSVAEKMQEDIFAAAEEKLAKNVSYMNGIRQPKDVRNGIPNLTRIIAMRAVGVLHQVNGVEATVSGYGCNLSALGNALRGDFSKKGHLTAVDAATGIYATAEYAGDKNDSAPKLEVIGLTAESERYQTFHAELGCDSDDLLVVYQITNKATPTTAYTLTLPMTQELLQAPGEFKFYSYRDGALQEFSMVAEDNLYTGEVETLDYIVVAKGTDLGINSKTENGDAGENADCGMPDEEPDDNNTAVENRVFGLDTGSMLPILVTAGVAVIALIAIAFIVVKKRESK